MEILFATQNRHKAEELKLILHGHKIITPEDMGISFEYEETGNSFLENSLGKAMALHKLTKKPVIADDSGLSVPALNGEPGIFSARYGSKEKGMLLEADERNRYLLDRMNGIVDREAYFVCCMTLVLSSERFFTAQETMEGIITSEPAGINGFGYDPLFFLPAYGKTVAEIPEEEKNRISHRGRAGRVIASVLNSLEKK